MLKKEYPESVRKPTDRSTGRSTPPSSTHYLRTLIRVRRRKELIWDLKLKCFYIELHSNCHPVFFWSDILFINVCVFSFWALVLPLCKSRCICQNWQIVIISISWSKNKKKVFCSHWRVEKESAKSQLTYDRGGLPVVDSGWAWSCHDSYRGGASENFAPPRANVAAPKLPYF